MSALGACFVANGAMLAWLLVRSLVSLKERRVGLV
jgi:hypothetical protein